MGDRGVVALAKASANRTKANRADLEALQIRTLDSVAFNPAFAALTAHDPAALRLAVRRLRPGYRPVFRAWLAQHPLTNPHAAPGPSYLPQYRIAQAAQSRRLDGEADAAFLEGRKAGRPPTTTCASRSCWRRSSSSASAATSRSTSRATASS